ncbi:hypothetical protein AAHA92_32781 [Salvia divinorum]|uniref:Stomatal closure-related actin-binding protein coiled-coil domain-containing protein n=1 Tax=Salvia divinorum TaxID=28513 RepID=A0ABD1FLU6_SALDI
MHRLVGRELEGVDGEDRVVSRRDCFLFLIQEKFEVKKLVNFLKQDAEDDKNLVNQEKYFGCAEIEM